MIANAKRHKYQNTQLASHDSTLTLAQPIVRLLVYCTDLEINI